MKRKSLIKEVSVLLVLPPVFFLLAIIGARLAPESPWILFLFAALSFITALAALVRGFGIVRSARRLGVTCIVLSAAYLFLIVILAIPNPTRGLTRALHLSPWTALRSASRFTFVDTGWLS